MMSFLRIGDRAAGAIKSGGTTRRAAKMVTVDVDHPDIEEYINWKVVEEQKVAALVAGSKLTGKNLKSVMDACNLSGYKDEERINPKINIELKKAILNCFTFLTRWIFLVNLTHGLGICICTHSLVSYTSLCLNLIS
jgi:ribonucleoside-diphosphate reductase alpha chain